MASDTSIWYRLGHALERARHVPAAPEGAERGQVDDQDTALPRPETPSSDELMAMGITFLVDRALDGWGRRREPGIGGLLRAAASGAIAALLVDLVRPLLRDDADLPGIDHDTAGRMLVGLGQGLVYGGVVEPRVPGPSLLKGAVYGSVEYAVHPMGGLSGLLGSHTPQGRIPFVGDLLGGLADEDRAYLEHLIFGIALALIYESSPASNGIRPDDE